MSVPLLRWGLVLLVCLLAPAGFAKDVKVRKAKAKASRMVRIHGGHRMHRDAAAAFERMTAEARESGRTLLVTSAWRSYRQQHYLWRLYRKGLGPKAARPGRSNHNRGLAVDLVVGSGLESPTYLWLAGNACRFGFRRTVASEPWHWEYRPRSTPKPRDGEDCLGRPLDVEQEPAPAVVRTDAS
ncbi:D-alanyl-D-alanine carboxypeptidase [Corallococcus sp. ZKHCc1 1396]|uniref:D-alanyl-D-alanine carboxypeptidase n=1 Tax=Corallococcus soli TaxID=2710757 RepID=A0ABR9PUG7_9BACT|nr:MULTISPECIES: M15 family metallopeptidase [Corallococcus]MBE4751577.1 D-alanyl-D-alanine carboxypeptidase [Corallococcus soli]MCY1030708.1 M15 family metallopeptidase [Corallococcus sp. BB11-1]